VGQFSPDASRQLDSIELGHHEVRDHDVRPLAVHDGECLLTICRLTDDLHVGHWCEEVANDLAIVLRVVDNDDGEKADSPLLTRGTGRAESLPAPLGTTYTSAEESATFL
jgi:hypothetical protein